MSACGTIWSSLANFPAPDTSAPTLCEFESCLVSEKSSSATILVKEIIIPPLHINVQDVFRSATSGKQGGKLAKEAFLPTQRNQTAIKKAFTVWYEEGWSSALEELASAPDSKSLSSDRINQALSFLARSVLAAYRFTSNIHGSFNPHLMMSGEDMINRFSRTRDWTEALVRALAWHPHTPKFAIALKDDSIQVHGSKLSISPILKYKQQRGISCLSWRPFSASELAVGCLGGVLVWVVDPSSVVARPSSSCVTLLQQPGHAPVTAVEWDPQGKLLLSSSAADTSMIIWNTASETHVPLKRVGGGGVHLVSWSPNGKSIMAATPSTVFRVWDTDRWEPERWNVKDGYVNAACWSPNGDYLLFTTNADTKLYSLCFTNGKGSNSAIPIMDLETVVYDGKDGEVVSVGGVVHSMSWDPLGERLALSFKSSNLIALFCTRIDPLISISPIGFVNGLPDEAVSCFDFQKKFARGAMLSVAWSSGRVQHIPLLFLPSNHESRGPLPNCSGSVLDTSNSVPFHPQLFSSPVV